MRFATEAVKAAITVVAFTLIVQLAALTGCNNLGQRVPDHQIALGHLVAPQLALSPNGEDLIVISFAEAQPGQQTLVPLDQFTTRSWAIGAPYGLRTNGETYWLEPLSENAVRPQQTPTRQPAAPAPKPNAPKGAGGK